MQAVNCVTEYTDLIKRHVFILRKSHGAEEQHREIVPTNEQL
jgi:hypothetical protein